MPSGWEGLGYEGEVRVGRRSWGWGWEDQASNKEEGLQNRVGKRDENLKELLDKMIAIEAARLYRQQAAKRINNPPMFVG